MFSSPSTTSAAVQRRSVASSALRNAGLSGRVDEDIRMQDTAGGAKRSTRSKLHDKPTRSKRLEKLEEAASSAANKSSLASRLRAPAPSSLAIKGVSPSRGPAPSLSARAGAMSSRMGPRRNLITETGSRGSTAPASVDVLRQVVTRRWNAEQQFLNLERLAEDEIMKKHKIASLESRDAPRALGPVIFKLASELQPPCKTLSLANNNLSNTHTLHTLNHYLPNLNALSLENNKLRTLRDLDGLTSKASKGILSPITELVLRGNPIREIAAADGRLEDLKSEILHRFPMLAVLDQEALPRLAFDVEVSTVNAASSSTPTAPASTSFSLPMQSNLFLDGVDGTTGQFLMQYFTLFDTDRSPLGVVYAPQATFSLSANTSIPPRARKAGFQVLMPNQKSLNWDFYRAKSRNLERITGSSGAEKAVDLLRVGPQAILDALSRFPATKHDMSKGQNFVVDAFPVSGMLNGTLQYGTDALMVIVHGELSEGPSWGVRSFDRTFVLCIAPEGSPAQLAGWQCMILSDMYVLRNYSSSEAWQPGELAVGAYSSEVRARRTETHEALQRSAAIASSSGSSGSGIRGPPRNGMASSIPNPGSAASGPGMKGRPNGPSNSLTALLNDPILAGLPVEQRNLVIQLAQSTGLTVVYAGQCLEGNGWNLEQARANYESVKVSLPPDAFLSRS